MAYVEFYSAKISVHWAIDDYINIKTYPAEKISIAGFNSPDEYGVSLNIDVLDVSEVNVFINRSGAI